MRLGAPILDSWDTPEQWVERLRSKGYRAAYSPLKGNEPDSEIARYAAAAEKASIVIAEHGVWRCNCLDPDDTQRLRAVTLCAQGLAAAERLGARCCVSLSGSRGTVWSGPHRDNFQEDTFAMVVDNVRAVIDAVKPRRTFYTLEPMPWTCPWDVDSYQRLLRAVDRDAFGVHYDAANLVYSPERYYRSGQYIRHFVKRLGGRIRSCHVKDVRLADRYIFQVEECAPGLGELDYTALLQCLSGLDPDLPVLLEHLSTQQEYDRGVAFLRGKAAALGMKL